MAFSSIMTFICLGYVLAYGGMVIYDLFFAKEPVKLAPKVEEEEIDISDEAKSFNPVFIDGEGRFHWEQEKDQNDGKKTLIHANHPLLCSRSAWLSRNSPPQKTSVPSVSGAPESKKKRTRCVPRALHRVMTRA